MHMPYIESWPQVQSQQRWAQRTVEPLCVVFHLFIHIPGRGQGQSTNYIWSLTLCVCVRRRWASCSFLTTSQTAWSTSPPWWTTSGTTRETDPQTWVDPITLDCLLLLLIPSCPPFTTNPTISGLPPPRLLPPPTAASVPVYTMSIDIACYWIAGRCPFKNVYLYSLSSLQSKV